MSSLQKKRSRYNSRQNKQFLLPKMRLFISLLKKISTNSWITPFCLRFKQRSQQNKHKGPSIYWKDSFPTRKLTHQSKVLARSPEKIYSKRRCMMWLQTSRSMMIKSQLKLLNKNASFQAESERQIQQQNMITLGWRATSSMWQSESCWAKIKASRLKNYWDRSMTWRRNYMSLRGRKNWTCLLWSLHKRILIMNRHKKTPSWATKAPRRPRVEFIEEPIQTTLEWLRRFKPKDTWPKKAQLASWILRFHQHLDNVYLQPKISHYRRLQVKNQRLKTRQVQSSLESRKTAKQLTDLSTLT